MSFVGTRVQNGKGTGSACAAAACMKSMSVIMMPDYYLHFMLLASLSKLQLVLFPAGDKSTYYL